MDWTIGSILPYAAKRFGEKIALVCQDRAFSFVELEKLTNKAASGLQKLGVARGDRVTLYCVNCWEWLVSYYAIHKLGAVANPINVMLTASEVAYVANDCGAKVIIASADKGAALQAIRDACPIEHIVLFGDHRVAGAQNFNAILASGDENFERATVSPESLSTIGYTSGTTGHPKGAMLSHRAVMHSTAMTAMMHMRTPSDIGVSALPCSHVYGNVVMNGAFWFGQKFILFEKFEVKPFLEAIQNHRATIVDGVPTMYMYLLSSPDLKNYDLSSLQRCTVGGQTMPIGKLRECEEVLGCPILELWGMTELAGVATTHSYYAQNRLGSIGLAVPGLECRIASLTDPSQTAAIGEVGEIMVRGPTTMFGYFGNEEATREAMTEDGWLRTSDIGTMDKDGYFYVVDRKKDMIITGGFNIYPAELERVISTHPDVAMVAVGPEIDSVKGELAKAYIVLKQGCSPTAEEVIAFCRIHLAAYKVPRAVKFVHDLPKTSTGKIMRRQLKTMDDAAS